GIYALGDWCQTTPKRPGGGEFCAGKCDCWATGQGNRAANGFDTTLLAALWETRNLPAFARLAGVAALLLAASLANPLGIGLLRFTLGASRLQFNRLFIGEWRAPDLQSAGSVPLMATLLLSLALSLLFRTVSLDKAAALALLTSAVAVLQSNEFMPFFAVVGAPILALMLASIIRRPLEVRISGLHLAAFAGTLALLLALSLRSLTAEPYDRAMARVYPAKAVTFIQSQQLHGPIWNDYGWGAYLISALPRLPVFVDGRAELYGDDFLRRYMSVENARVAPNETFDRYRINLALISSHHALATELRQNPDWREVFRDQVSSLFVRSDGPDATVTADLESPVPTGESARRRAAAPASALA
ncbi:MAG: hypothetical protein KGJ86_09365, partial [Chloroflexota bacterium]|nr:hypothetical protein [Chloroflexota bacterium]